MHCFILLFILFSLSIEASECDLVFLKEHKSSGIIVENNMCQKTSYLSVDTIINLSPFGRLWLNIKPDTSSKKGFNHHLICQNNSNNIFQLQVSNESFNWVNFEKSHNCTGSEWHEDKLVCEGDDTDKNKVFCNLSTIDSKRLSEMFQPTRRTSVRISSITPTAEEMADILLGDSKGRTKSLKTRSISFGKVKMKTDFILNIKFKLNSETITENSKLVLNILGSTLSIDRMVNEKIQIKGHTDATGTKEHNIRLSKKRAKVVKKYLMDNFSIASNRLLIAGVGENEPLVNANPNDKINRRVEIYPLYH